MSVATQASTAPQVGKSYVLKASGCLCGMTGGGERKAIYRTDSLTDIGRCTKVENGRVYLNVESNETEPFTFWVGVDVFEREMALLQ